MKTDAVRKHALAVAVLLALLPVAAIAQDETPSTPAASRQDDGATKKAVNLDQMVVTASPAALTKMGSSISVSTLS